MPVYRPCVFEVQEPICAIPIGVDEMIFCHAAVGAGSRRHVRAHRGKLQIVRTAVTHALVYVDDKRRMGNLSRGWNHPVTLWKRAGWRSWSAIRRMLRSRVFRCMLADIASQPPPPQQFHYALHAGACRGGGSAQSRSSCNRSVCGGIRQAPSKCSTRSGRSATQMTIPRSCRRSCSTRISGLWWIRRAGRSMHCVVAVHAACKIVLPRPNRLHDDIAQQLLDLGTGVCGHG